MSYRYGFGFPGRTMRGPALSLAIVAAALLGGCGGGGSTTTVSSRYPALVPRAAFVKQAKAICAASKERLSNEVNAFYEKRARETGESLGAVGTFENVRDVVVPSLRHELTELEAIGLPKGAAYEAEAVWQTMRTVVHEVEDEGIYAWRSAKLLPPFRNRARPFGLDNCILN